MASEGWLTESALVPKAAKPIAGVSQRSHRHLLNTIAQNRVNTIAQNRVKQKQGRAPPKPKPLSAKQQSYARSVEILEKKEALYNKLATGEIKPEDALEALRNDRKQRPQDVEEGIHVDFDSKAREAAESSLQSSDERDAIKTEAL